MSASLNPEPEQTQDCVLVWFEVVYFVLEEDIKGCDVPTMAVC